MSPIFLDMEDMPGDPGKSESRPSNITGWPLDFIENLKSLSLVSREKTLSSIDNQCFLGRAESSSQTASQVFWSTGTLSGPIPNGFYSIIPDKKLKQIFDTIPFPDDLLSFGMEGLKADIILVDAEKDKKLSMLKQLSAAFGKGLNSNPASLIKKIAGLVSDFYKHPNLEPAKTAVEDMSHLMENHGIQLLGQIRHGSCRPRAILFKVLADVVGLESKLVVGLPSDGPVEYTDSCRHMSVTVMVNSVELLVDLMRSPGQLIPFSAKAMFMSHISAAAESDSADYDSCDSPLEPNSPLYGFYDKTDSECQEYDDKLRSLYQRRVEASSKLTGSLQKVMLRSSTYSEGTSSPEHPLNRARGPSLLSGNRHSFREYADGMAVSRSDGASTSNTRRTRQRSFSITPVIGDDIVRAVRAMNEKLKQSRLLSDQADETASSQVEKDNINDSPRVVSNYHLDGHDEVFRIRHKSTQKAISLPSSPHQLRGRTPEICMASNFLITEDLISRWNNVFQSSFLNKPLQPFQEWSIDFSELTVGRRIGIGFFGEVFQGIWNGTDVAIKVFLEQDLTTENMEDFCNEVSIMSRLRHPNVVLFLGACMKPPHLSMVAEYMEYGSLYHLIHNSGQKKKLSWRRRLKMLRDICRGLLCMHRMKIVHRDLKSANCLVNRHWTVKICDFGLSRVMTDAPTSDISSAGTPEWMAPELIRNEPFTEKCDIFSLGVIMWELCTLNRPWEGVPKAQVVYSVANEGSRLDIPEGPLGSLISDCWAEPNKRPSCQEILTRLLDCEYTLC